jgi:hypothetical protein
VGGLCAQGMDGDSNADRPPHVWAWVGAAGAGECVCVSRGAEESHGHADAGRLDQILRRVGADHVCVLLSA